MLHSNFRGNRPTSAGEEDFGRVLTIYGHGGHLGQVTSIILMSFIISMYLKAYIQNVVKNGPVVSEISMF